MATKQKPQDHLDWEEFKDFTYGLWQRETDRECPRNGLLALMDGYPLPAGGLRAWGTWQPIPMTNINNNTYILGIFHIPGPNFGTAATGGLYLHALQVNQGGAGSHQFQLWKFQYGTNPDDNNLPNATWTLLKTVSGITDITPSQHMQSFRFSTGGAFTFRNFYNLDILTTGGIYKTDGTTVSTANVLAYTLSAPDVMIPYQARILTVSMESFMQNIVRYTSVAAVAAPTTAQYIIPAAEISSPITWAAVIEPSDLFINKQEVGMYNLQGDITDPIVRQMGWQHSNSRTYPVQTDLGLIILNPTDGVYAFNGSAFTPLSEQLLGAPMQADPPGQIAGVQQGGEPTFNTVGNTYTFNSHMAATDDFLFAGQNYVMDLRTKAWFQVTSPNPGSGTPTWFCNDVFFHHIIHARSLSMQTNRILLYYEDNREDNLHRASSYTFTLPLIYRDHDFVQLRAIEFYVHTFGAGSSIQVSITAVALNGTASTTNLAASSLPNTANNYQVRFDLPGHASHSYKIAVTMSANAGVEAPMIEKILVGTAPSIAMKQI